jgi:putative ABC transport system permease protein
MNNLKQAIRALRANMGRTILTTIGIVIGVATVIIVLAAGEGFRGFINSQVEAFGTNAIFIQTKVPPSTKDRNSGSSGSGPQDIIQAVEITTLKDRDIKDIKKLNNVKGAYGAVTTQKVVNYKNVTKNVFIFGAGEERFDIDQSVLAQGRYYTSQENLGAEQVAILGADVAVDLFSNEDPVDKSIKLGGYNFRVIGVYERKGSFGFSNDDQQVFIPLVTAQKKLLGTDHLGFALAQFKDSTMAEATAEDIRYVLRTNHGITDAGKDDFDVQTSSSGLETFDSILAGVTFLLIAIAAISLLVGGVGIMNIMYVVVTERISEIGLKKALGARSSDILNEFLLEAIILTLIGGVLGIILGSAMAFGIALIAKALNFSWTYTIPLSGIFLGLGVSSGIGIIFGVFPARRAAKMDPIEALRYE